MHRNDGIGGTPRLARYTSIGTPLNTDPTPNRPPLPQRNPGESDIAQDSHFHLAGARAVAPAPAGAMGDNHHSPELTQAIRDANATARTHIPNRTTGECTPCGDAETPCRPFKRAMAILDKWEPASARRVRAVLHLSGLSDRVLEDDDA